MKPLEYHLLQAYLDSELTATETTAVEARLATCPTSRQRLDQLRQRANTARTLLQTPDVAIPVFTKPSSDRQPKASEVITREHSKHDSKPGKRFHLGYAPWLFALAACLTGVLWLLQPFKASETPKPSLHFYQEPIEVDANRPYAEQTTSVYLLSQEMP